MLDVYCKECGETYEISSGTSADDYQCSQCNGDLKYVEVVSSSTNENKYIRETVSVGKVYIDKQISNYNNLMYIGLGIVLIGLLGLLLASSIIFAFIILGGYFALAYGYNESHKWKKGSKDEKLVSKYLNKLPEGYYVFNNVKLPTKRCNIDHIVLGPSGLFVIETINLEGHYTVNGDEWLYDEYSQQVSSNSNPGKEVKSDTIALKQYLMENNINLNDTWVNSVVAFKGKYKIRKPPENYDLMLPERVATFILEGESTLNSNIIEKTLPLIKSYSIDYSF